jgi:hypothetical protein
MRIIDADALFDSLIFPNDQWEKTFKELLDDEPTVDPSKWFDGMTNGEVIQALFPKAKVFKEESNIEYPYVDVFLYSENDMNCYKKDWWNAPYQKGGEE